MTMICGDAAKMVVAGKTVEEVCREHGLMRPACWRFKSRAFQEGCMHCDYTGECTHPQRAARAGS